VGTYSYKLVSVEIPPIPLIAVQLTAPGTLSDVRVDCQGILDTGSDCTLVPLPFLMRLNISPASRSVRLSFGGKETIGVPYEVGLIFDRYHKPDFRVIGCPVESISELLIIGRDLMNQYRIEFDGPNLRFTIF
jgi:hypothetical protein